MSQERRKSPALNPARLARWLRTRPQGNAEASRERQELTPPTPLRDGVLGVLAAVVEDIDAVLEHDPAANNPLEVLLVYPGLHALWMHRLAHRMWKRGNIMAPRLLAHFNRFVTGIEIHPGATIGRRVFIDHGMGIVIGETATVGDECLLYKGVVLGGTSLERKERHPTLGRGVVVGTNACIIGAIQVGDQARVGSGSVVIRDVPAGCTAVGIPGRCVEGGSSARQQLDHADLPDPVANVITTLLDEVEALQRAVQQLRDGTTPPAGRFNEYEPFDDGTTGPEAPES